MTDERAMRLLQATREQLHDKLTREVEPFEIAQKARLNPYSREYVTVIRTYSTTEELTAMADSCTRHRQQHNR